MIPSIEARRSIRQYKQGTKVTKEQLTQMMHAAMLAPSACNSRPWEFIAVTKRDVLDEIARVDPYAGMCKSASAAVIVVAVPQTGMPEGYYPQDCGAATENILLEAASMGLGTCWCGIYPKPDRIASISKLFGIEEPKIPFCVIAVGVPGESPAQRGFYEDVKVRFVE